MIFDWSISTHSAKNFEEFQMSNESLPAMFFLYTHERVILKMRVEKNLSDSIG